MPDLDADTFHIHSLLPPLHLHLPLSFQNWPRDVITNGCQTLSWGHSRDYYPGMPEARVLPAAAPQCSNSPVRRSTPAAPSKFISKHRYTHTHTHFSPVGAWRPHDPDPPPQTLTPPTLLHGNAVPYSPGKGVTATLPRL